jgi:hypothetical protein
MKVNTADLALLQKEIIDLTAEISPKESEVKVMKETLESKKERMIAALTEAGLTSFRSPLGMVTVNKKFSVALPKSPDDWQKFFAYLQERGHYEALRTVNSQRLNGWYKEEMEAAKGRGDMDFAPPGLPEPSVHEVLSMRK